MLSNSWVKYISNIEFYIHPTENEDRDRVKICSEIQDFKNTYVLFHCLVAQSCPTVCNPWTVAHQAPLSVGFASKNAGVGCHFLLQGIFPNQGLNPCLLHWQADSLPLSHQGSPHGVLIYRGDIVTTGKASATEGRIYHLHFLRGQGTPCHAGPHGEAQGLLRRQKQERGKPSQSLCLWVLWMLLVGFWL